MDGADGDSGITMDFAPFSRRNVLANTFLFCYQLLNGFFKDSSLQELQVNSLKMEINL